MINHFHRPRPGETVALVCKSCGATFFGPNPDGWGLWGLFRSQKPATCPKCGGKKVERSPWVLY